MLEFVKSIICLVYFDIEVRKEKNVHKNVFSVIFFSIWIRVLLDTFVWGFFSGTTCDICSLQHEIQK